jgi:hypothetical protein
MLETPIPRRPAPFLTQDPAAKARAISLMEFQRACAQSSGIDSVPGVADYQRCIARVSARWPLFYRLEYTMDCGREIGGMFTSQVELASGYEFNRFKRGRPSPISTAKRYHHLREHVRDGTWWWQICG